MIIEAESLVTRVTKEVDTGNGLPMRPLVPLKRCVSFSQRRLSPTFGPYWANFNPLCI